MSPLAKLALACFLLIIAPAPVFPGEAFSWQDAYAKVRPNGDLEWTPRAFRFEKAAPVRYIDSPSGQDDNDGTTKSPPTRRHDPRHRHQGGKVETAAFDRDAVDG